MRVCPYNFDCLGLEVADTVMQLVNKIFVNDVPELQHGGKLRPILVISDTRLIGFYNEGVRDGTAVYQVVVTLVG